MRGLKGKRAIVTGAGSGIGAAIAERFAAEGAQVVVSDVSEKSASRIIGINLTGAFFGVKHAARVMKKAGRGGVIVNMDSVPAEIASLVAYLASDEAGFLTGATYLIDGGYTAG